MSFNVFGPPQFLDNLPTLWGGMNLDKSTISFIVNDESIAKYELESENKIFFAKKRENNTDLLMVNKGRWDGNEMHWNFDEWEIVKKTYLYGRLPMNANGSATQVKPNLYVKHEGDKVIFITN